MAVEKVTDGVIVSIVYRLTVDGEVVEDTPADDPLDYLHGAENIVPGLERVLAGKQVGDKVNVTLKPEDAYGEYDEDDVEEIDRNDVPESVELGMEILLEDEEGFMFEAVVKEVTEDTVILDFNHMLAGKTVTYDVEIVGLREADAEELAHGHPHSLGDDDEDYDDFDEE